MDERRTVRQVLLNCVKLTQESILGDQNDKHVNTATSLARDRIERKRSGPRVAVSPTWGISALHYITYDNIVRRAESSLILLGYLVRFHY